MSRRSHPYLASFDACAKLGKHTQHGYTKAHVSQIDAAGQKWVAEQKKFADATIDRINKATTQTDDKAIHSLLSGYANFALLFRFPSDYMQAVDGEYDDDENPGGRDMRFRTWNQAATYELLECGTRAAGASWRTIDGAVEKLAGAKKRGLYQDFKRAVDVIWKGAGGPQKGRRERMAPELQRAAEKLAANEPASALVQKALRAIGEGRKIEWRPGDEPCDRCGGIGWISAFAHVDGGICFDCHGRGIAMTREEKRHYWGKG